MTENHHFNNQHHAHRHNTIDRSHNRHRPTNSEIPSCLHDYGQQNQITINANSSVHAGPSRPPLIHPSTETSNASTINIEPLKDHLSHLKQREQLSNQMTESQEYRSKIHQQTNKMAPKQTRAVAKAKELQTTETPLVRRLKNIKNAKVQEGSWEKLWAEIKE